MGQHEHGAPERPEPPAPAPRVKDGGPAFPRSPGDSGMSLRDYFAGQALIGMIASAPITDRTDPRKVNKPGWARQAYGFADAMLEARKDV
jgi:hypothetical protein